MASGNQVTLHHQQAGQEPRDLSDKGNNNKPDKESGKSSIYHHKLKAFMKTEPLQSNRNLQQEFGLRIGTAVFFISLLIVPRHIMGHRVEEECHLFDKSQDACIEIPDIFGQDTQGKHPRRVLVLGAAGSGKTTLIHHCCEEWALGNLWSHFRYVFLLTCRRLNHKISKNTNLSMLDMLLDRGPRLSQDERDIVKREIFANQGHSLVIVDGVDELAKWEDFIPDDISLIRDMEKPAEIIVLFHSILSGHLMDKANFVFTSRPIDRIDADQFERSVKIFGFDQKAIEKCILALSNGDNEKCRRILEYLNQRPQLKMFCTLPLGCIMTGKVVFDELSDTSENKDPHETMNCATLLIIKVLFALLHKRNTMTTSRDRYELIRQLRDTLLKIMRLAAFGILDRSRQVIFDSTVLRDHGIGADALRYGFLDIDSDQNDFTSLPTNATCSFIHLSIQEFFAALHIAVTWKNKDISMITSREASHQFNMVLLYLSGLLGNPMGHRLIQAIDDTIKSSKLTKRLNKLLNKLVIEYEGRFRFLPTLTKKGKDGTKLGRLQIIRCVAEGNKTDLVKKMDRLVLKANTLDLSDMPGGILLEHIPAISFYLQSTKAVESLVLEKMYCVNLMRMITSENQARLVPLLDGCVLEGGTAEAGEPSGILNLSEQKLTEEDVRGISQYIAHSTEIRELRLEKMSCVKLMEMITLENQARLVPLLDGAFLVSGHLDLRGIKLSEDDVTRLMAYVITTESLHTIDTSTAVQLMKEISPENQARLVPLLDGACLVSGNLDLHDIQLSENDVTGLVAYVTSNESVRIIDTSTAVQLMRMITPENQTRLVPLLDGCVRRVREGEPRGILTLSGEILTEEDVRGVSQYIVNSTAIRELSLKACGITDQGAAFLARGLEVNTSLEELTLKNCRITAQGAAFLARGLEVNTSLEKLNLENNQIADNGATALASALKINKTLQQLHLQSNHITDDGATALASALKINKTLQELLLDRNQITDDGATALASVLKINKSLQLLSLIQTQITDDGATALASALKINKTLELLFLWNNVLSGAKERELVQLLGRRVAV